MLRYTAGGAMTPESTTIAEQTAPVVIPVADANEVLVATSAEETEGFHIIRAI